MPVLVMAAVLVVLGLVMPGIVVRIIGHDDDRRRRDVVRVRGRRNEHRRGVMMVIDDGFMVPVVRHDDGRGRHDGMPAVRPGVRGGRRHDDSRRRRVRARRIRERDGRQRRNQQRNGQTQVDSLLMVVFRTAAS